MNNSLIGVVIILLVMIIVLGLAGIGSNNIEDFKTELLQKSCPDLKNFIKENYPRNNKGDYRIAVDQYLWRCN